MEPNYYRHGGGIRQPQQQNHNSGATQHSESVTRIIRFHETLSLSLSSQPEEEEELQDEFNLSPSTGKLKPFHSLVELWCGCLLW